MRTVAKHFGPLWIEQKPSDTQDFADQQDDFVYSPGIQSYPSVSVGAAPNMSLFLKEAGDRKAISFQDIHQGQMGDCFLLSSLGELAMHNRMAFRSIVSDNPDGTESVSLYERGPSGALRTSVSVSDIFNSAAVNNGATQGVVNGVKEIWVQSIEKAYAMLNASDLSSAAAMNKGGALTSIMYGGLPVQAMEALTGNTGNGIDAASVSQSFLSGLMAGNDLVVFDTQSNIVGNQYGLYGNHAYMFDHIVGSGTSAAVLLDNPWGFANPSPIPILALGTVFTEVDYCKA